MTARKVPLAGTVSTICCRQAGARLSILPIHPSTKTFAPAGHFRSLKVCGTKGPTLLLGLPIAGLGSVQSSDVPHFDAHK